ncbi:MAG: ATP-binding protein [Gemmatimonadales bacterium]
MSMTPLFGHQELRDRLNSAIATDRLPQVLLLTGPSGVGKQRLALWLAQRLLCERGLPEPCGECGACRRTLDLVHPDLHWFVPVPRPKAGDADKQVEEVAESLEAAMADRRAGGQWGSPDGMASHGIASARLLQRRAGLTAAEGGWRVFVVGHAERLVPQESSPEAANALLKLLEEPPARALFLLTAPEAGLVLTTIRSRAVPVRVGRLADADVRAWAAAAGVATDELAIRAAGGAIGRLGRGGADPQGGAARRVLEAVDGGPAARARAALGQGVSQARGDFTALLDALAVELAEQARSASAGGRWPAAGRAAAGVELVLETRERAQGNVNPQLALAVLMDDLAALEAA